MKTLLLISFILSYLSAFLQLTALAFLAIMFFDMIYNVLFKYSVLLSAKIVSILPAK